MVTIGKLISTGMGAARMTQAGLQKLLLDTKDNVSSLLVAEIKKFLSQINIHEELARALTGLQLEISATIKVRPQTGAQSAKKPRKTAR